MVTNHNNKGPQFPARQEALPTTLAGRKRNDERLLRISGEIAGVGYKTDLSICTYNARGLSRDDQLLVLMKEKEKIKCDVLGICETRRREELHATWNDGTQIFLGRGSGQQNVGGIGFIVSPNLSYNIMSCHLKSSRIGILFIKLQKKRTLKVIQVYAPTSACDDEEVEEFYRELYMAEQEKSTYTIIMGDFNAKLGRGKPTERYIGRYGMKERNERGERLATMAETKRYFVGNSWFRKKPSRRWTWISPNAKTKNEIDFVLIDRKRLLQNVEVIQLFNTGSDHRLLRAKIIINMQTERRKLMKSQANKECVYTWDTQQFAKTLQEAKFQQSEDIDADYTHFLTTLKHCASKAEIKAPRLRKVKLSEDTRLLMQKRKVMQRSGVHNVEYSLLCKLIRKKVKDDILTFKQERLLQAAEERKSVRKCRKSLVLYRNNLKALRDKEGLLVNSREGMERICKEFYSELLSSRRNVPAPRLPASKDQPPPPILISEVRHVIEETAVGKAPGRDGITIELLKAGGYPIWTELVKMFTRYLELKQIPRAWKESKTILLFKKGDRENIKNYRPICLLSQIYKVFTKIIAKRIAKTLDEQQPREQAGFRSGFSTRDHLFCLTQLLERSREYKLPLCLVFVDFEKAFDSIEVNGILQSLVQQGVDSQYIELLRNINTDCSTEITLFYNPLKIPVKKGVRQGDTISPILFSACLEMVLRKTNWKGGVTIDGEHLTHLRFADDIVLIGKSISESQQMLRELEKVGNKIGLKINRSKTKFIRSQGLPRAQMKLGGRVIEEVEKYVYLGQEVNAKNDLMGEIQRRKRAGWLKFNETKDILLQPSLTPKMKAEIFNSTVLPTMLYGCETWAPTITEIQKLEVTIRAMERMMLGISLRDHVPNEEIRRRSGVYSVAQAIRTSRLKWAGHVCRMQDGRWTTKVLDWYPRGVKRPPGRPPKRWEDQIKEICGATWKQIARNRAIWKEVVKGRHGETR